MSLSGALDSKTGRIISNLIPPEISKGELITGGYVMHPSRRQYLESIKRPNDLDKVVVPAGEDGSVLQADSTTNTGLRWVPHEPVAKSLRKSVNSIARFLKPLVQERALKEAERLESMQKLFVKTNIMDGITYTVPFDSTKPVESVIDYLDEMFLFSLMNNCSRVTVIFEDKKLDLSRTLAACGVQHESTLYVTCIPDVAVSAGGSKRRTGRRTQAVVVGRRRNTNKKNVLKSIETSKTSKVSLSKLSIKK